MNPPDRSSRLPRSLQQARVALLVALLVCASQALAAWHAVDVAAGHGVAADAGCASCLVHGAGHAPLPVTPWHAPAGVMAAASVALPPAPAVPVIARPGAARAPPLRT
ncbi:MAG: hypothetical protein RLW62_20035 [Gammaproteobacteria bacterium]